MHREYHRWFARPLGRDMELLAFGHAGPPMIVFPTSMGAFYEFEDRGMVGAVGDKLAAGRLRLFCVSSVDSESWYNRHAHPRQRVQRHLEYEGYILDDVVPLVRQMSGTPTMGVTGVSFGGYHAMVFALRHPHTFTWCVTMGAAFDIAQFLGGYFDDDCYFLNPTAFLPGLGDPRYLDQYRRNKWVLGTGDHDICRRDNEVFSDLLWQKGVPNSLHVWNGSKHDWPDWLPMASAYLP